MEPTSSTNFFTTCCKNRCIATTYIALWKLSVHIYILLFGCCFGRDRLLQNIQIPTYLTPKDQRTCRDYIHLY